MLKHVQPLIRLRLLWPLSPPCSATTHTKAAAEHRRRRGVRQFSYNLTSRPGYSYRQTLPSPATDDTTEQDRTGRDVNIALAIPKSGWAKRTKRITGHGGGGNDLKKFESQI